MVILELMFQGVRAFSPKGKLTLKPGHVVVQGPPQSRLPLSSLVGATLYPRAGTDDAALVTPGEAGGKAALTFSGNDNVTYFLMRNLGVASALKRFDQATQALQPVADKPEEIRKLLAQAVPLTPEQFGKIFTLRPAHLPSAVRAAANTKPDPKTPDGKLALLETELQQAQELARLQVRQTELDAELAQVEGRFGELRQLETELQAAKVELEKYPSPEKMGLPPDIVAQAERYPDLIQKRDIQLLSLRGINVKDAGLRRCRNCGGYHMGDDHGAPVQMDVQPSYIPPLYKDGKVWASVATGLGMLVAGYLLDGMGKYVAGLDFVPFGYAGLLAWKYVQELQDDEKRIHQSTLKNVREKKVIDDFNKIAEPVVRAMKLLDVISPDRVVTHFQAGEPHLVRFNEIRQRIDACVAALKAEGTYDRAEEIRAEQGKIDGVLASSTNIRDVPDIEEDVAALKRQHPTLRSSGPKPKPDEDPLPGLLASAAAALKQTVPQLGAATRERCGQYLQALTQQRCTAIAFDDQGGATVTTAKGNLPWMKLAQPDLDLAYVAVRLTLAELVGRATKAPLVIDDALSALNPGLHPLLAKMLQQLGAVIQVLHATGTPAFAQAAAAVVQA